MKKLIGSDSGVNDMTGEELIARLRAGPGHDRREAADRIEALVKEMASGSFYKESDIDALQDRIKRLEAAMIQMRDDRTGFRHAVHFRRFITATLKGDNHE